MQLKTGHPACGPVVYLGGYVLAQLAVIAFLLPARYQVIAILADHTYHLGNLLGAVLQVSIHGNHDIALSHLKTAEQGGGLAVVAAELDALYDVGVIGLKTFNNAPGLICAAVIYKYNLVAELVLIHYAANPLEEFRN